MEAADRRASGKSRYAKTGSGRGHIDDGFWQGAPVGGFGAGTFSQTYRGDFARWHIKAGVHKYQPVYSNSFAMFQQSEGDPQGTAKVLVASHPQDGHLGSWNWDYPVGAGDYYALYPKSWFDYHWDKFPAHVSVEQFSPILPDNYRESSYPVAVYRWRADNPTNRTVTVSVLLSWTNMGGWFRTFLARSQRRHQQRKSQPLRERASRQRRLDEGNRFRPKPRPRLPERMGRPVCHRHDRVARRRSQLSNHVPGGRRRDATVWEPFAKTGRLANSNEQWTSTDEPLAGAIAVRFTLKPGESRVIPDGDLVGFPRR